MIGNLILTCCYLRGRQRPLSRLPGWMSTLAQGLPVTHGANAARQLIAGASLGHVVPLIAAEALVGAVYVAIGLSTHLALRARGAPRRDAGSRVGHRRISIALIVGPPYSRSRDPRSAPRADRRRHARRTRVAERRRRAARVLARARTVRVGRRARRARTAPGGARARAGLRRRARLRSVAAGDRL